MPAELAENTTKPVATMADAPVDALRQAPLKAEKPTEEEVEIVEVFVAQEPPPATLPATASFTPLIGLTGILSLGLVGVARFVLGGPAGTNSQDTRRWALPEPPERRPLRGVNCTLIP